MHVFRLLSSGSEVEPMEDEGVDSSEEGEVVSSGEEGDGAEGDSDVEEDLQLEMEDSRQAKADEMGVEHLATLERLRQNQRQDYLKVCVCSSYIYILFVYGSYSL